jgi:hypothetical protein
MRYQEDGFPYSLAEAETGLKGRIAGFHRLGGLTGIAFRLQKGIAFILRTGSTFRLL